MEQDNTISHPGKGKRLTADGVIGTGVHALTAAMTERARARIRLPRAEAPPARVQKIRLKAAA